jgi:YfiH family protein
MTTKVTPPAGQPPAPTGAFVWERVPWGQVLVCLPLAELARHGFTTRDLDPGRGAGSDAAWSAVAAWLGVPAAALWRLDQVHGCRALRVAEAAMAADAPLPSADAAITTRADVAVAVKAADCLPILLAHPAGAVAAVHAGWRGTAQGIARATVAQLAAAAGGAAGEIVAAIGPSIGPCCYEVGPEVRETFHVAGHAEGDLDRWFLPTESVRATHVLDMWKANRDQLVAAGVAAANVHVAGLCTATHADWLWSYRKQGPSAGRLLGVIRLAATPGGLSA